LNRADGKDYGVGDEVAGDHPGCFVGCGGEAACDVRKGDGGDRGVEDFHEVGSMTAAAIR
jgi:hypothetical protein